MNRLALTVLACSAAALGACSSSRGGNDAEPLRALLSADALVFTSFDANGDLRVSTEELEAGLTRELARADASGDGQLQPLEFQTWSNTALGGGNLPPYRLDFDRNVDNVITAEEFRSELSARARDYDVDQDGVLVRAEFVRQINQTRRLEDRPSAREQFEEQRRQR